MTAAALTPEEWQEREFSAHYGVAQTWFSIDHKGRIFVRGKMPGEDGRTSVLNEATDSPEVTRKVVTLCMAYAAECRETLGDDLDEGRRCAWAFTREDVALLQNVAVDVDGEWGAGRMDEPNVVRLLALAARIEALLPPPA